MVDLDVLRKCGTTNERLREVFTAKAPEDWNALEPDKRHQLQQDIKNREAMENWLLHVLQEHMAFSVKNYKLYAAADLAWDTVAITKDMVPLLLYAQGRVKLETVINDIKDLKDHDKFVKKDDKGQITGIDLPKFFETQINVVRSVVTRRLAAQSNKYSNFWPFYKYEARGTDTVSKLRADIVSQVMDIMADGYDYRHHEPQVVRDGFLYCNTVDFVRSAWEVEKHWRKKEGTAPDATDFEVEDYIKKEGVAWFNPHPSRTYWDNSHPLITLNTDTGCEYVGFWDAERYRDIRDNQLYFNRDSIPYQRTQGLWGLWSAYPAYFNQYLNQINPPFPKTIDPASENDRLANIGIYGGDVLDMSIFTAWTCRKIIPKQWGIGDYPFPVWVRMKSCSDRTIVFAEFLPSSPCAVLSINAKDDRQLNVSMAHNLMQYQDQMSNLGTALLMTIQQELTKIYAVNTDSMSADQQKAMRAKLEGFDFSGKPIVLEYSGVRAAEHGIAADKVITVNETRAGQSIESIIKAMMQLLQLIERMESISPNEQGQPAPREISATEVNEIANTTTSVYSFISDAIDEYRAAKKRICYESYMACSQDKFIAPVQNRYTRKTIEAAGLTPVGDEDDASGPTKRWTVTGHKSKLRRHDYIFTTRDGAERPLNTQAANTLVQLLAQVVNLPTVLQAMGKEKLYGIINEVFRLSGCGLDLNIELKDGEDDSFGPDQVKQLTQYVQQLAEAVHKDTVDMAALKELANKLADQVKQDTTTVQQLVKQMPVKESITISYKDAPPLIRAQMEARAGFKPVSDKLPETQTQSTNP